MQISKARAQALIDYLHRHIPLCRAMQVALGGVGMQGITLTAPLSVNHNDKGGAFGGSLAALCTLSGWAAVSYLCQDAGLDADMLVSESNLRYRKPITEPTLCATAAWPENCELFLAELKAGGHARITVQATACAAGSDVTAVEFSGQFYVWQRPPPAAEV